MIQYKSFSWSAWALTLFILLAAVVSTASANTEVGFKNESEAGVVVTSGNAPTQSYNFKQQNAYGWDKNTLKLNGRFLKTIANQLESARNWAVALRFERGFGESWSLFAGQELQSDVFAGIDQRYNTDLGGKYLITKSDALKWNAEAGYRYTNEFRVNNTVQRSQYGRVYSEAIYTFNPTVSAKYWLEYLPNFSFSNDWQLNTELSLSATLTEIFSVKTGYLVRYDNQINVGATKTTDTTFTTALVAKF